MSQSRLCVTRGSSYTLNKGISTIKMGGCTRSGNVVYIPCVSTASRLGFLLSLELNMRTILICLKYL